MGAKYLALSLSAGMCIMAPSIAHYPPENKYPRQTIHRVPLLAAECATEGDPYEETWL
jgi:hypothetical protein